MGLLASAMATDMPMASTPFPPMASSPLPLINPLMKQQFVSGSTPFVPNMMSNFSSPSPVSGSGASFVPPGYGIQQVFYPPAIFYPPMGSSYGSYPNIAPSVPSPMTQNSPFVGLQGHSAPVHQVPWMPTPASTCQGCNLIYRGLPYPGLVPSVQVPLSSNVPYVRNIPLQPMTVNSWMPHNVQPLVEPLVQNLPNLYNPEPIPSPVPVPSEPVPVVPKSVEESVVPEPSVAVVPESSEPVAVKESQVPALRKKRAVMVTRSWPYYGYRYSSWPYYGYRSYLGGYPYYGYRSFYPYRSWTYPNW